MGQQHKVHFLIHSPNFAKGLNQAVCLLSPFSITSLRVNSN